MQKRLWGTILGNLLEHFDSALFSVLAPFFAPLFFPHQSPLVALMMTYAIIPLGMIARPLGALYFGYIGDTFGRRKSLEISLLGTAAVSLFMGFLPTYSQIGLFAPLLLSCARLLQNFFAAGEITGGIIYLLDHAKEKQQDLMSSIYDCSTIAGILLASAAVSLLYAFAIIDTGWRFLYFLGCSTGLVAYFFRKGSFLAEPTKTPVEVRSYFAQLQLLFQGRKTLFLIMIASGFSYSAYSIAFVLMNGFIPLISPITKAEVMHLNTFLLVLDFCLLPLFGLLAHRYSREKMMGIAAATAALSGIPLFLLLEQANIWTLLCVRSLFVLIGVWFSATLFSWFQNLVPKNQRSLVISLGYALGSQLLGGPTAAISLWMYQQTHLVSSAAWYWVFLGTVSAALIFAKKTRAVRGACISQ